MLGHRCLLFALTLTGASAFAPTAFTPRLSAATSASPVFMQQKRPVGGGLPRGQFAFEKDRFKRNGPKVAKKRPKGGGLSRGEFKKDPNLFKRSASKSKGNTFGPRKAKGKAGSKAASGGGGAGALLPVVAAAALAVFAVVGQQ